MITKRRFLTHRKSLDGLSVGDAFGESFFRRSPYETKFDDLPARWLWTDDTQVGGYFHNDLKRAVEEAQLSAMVTHSHPEGKAGAIAVAVAAAISENRPYPKENDFLKEVLPFVPDSITKDRIHRAAQISPDALTEAMFTLGTGSEVSAQDTVPFCLWSAAHHLDNFEEALWWTV